MRAAAIPPDLEIPPGWSRVVYGPPPGMTEEQVYTHEALVGTIDDGGPLDGAPCIAVLIELEPGDLEALQASGLLRLRLLSTGLPPWILEPVVGP